jgi:hypothetical protein
MIQASCGHKVDDFDLIKTATTPEYNKRGERAVSYRTVCVDCYNDFKKEGALLETESDCYDWLMGRS